MLISITESAKQCGCDPATLRKWIKKNCIIVSEIMSLNHKMTHAIKEDDMQKFKSYWHEITTIPEGWVTIPNIASKNDVDRKTVRLWIEKNFIDIRSQRISTGSPTSIIKIEDAEKFHEEYHNSDCVLVQNLLDNYNTDWRVIQRWAKKHKRDFVKVKSQAGGRANYCLTKNDASDCEKYLMKIKGKGWLYLVQPVPELNSNRIKIGWSKNPFRRLNQHRCVCPNAKIVKQWKCDQNRETPIRNEVTHDCFRFHTVVNGKKQPTEVYDCSDFELVVQRIETLLKC